MTNKEAKNQEITEEQAEVAIMIEGLSKDILKALKEGNTNVDIQLLMESIEAYASYPNYHEPSVRRWKERIAEITKLLEEQYVKVQNELQEIIKNNPKLAAYQKAENIEEE